MGTAVARNEEQPKGIVALFDAPKAKQQITPFLRGASYDRVVSEVVLAVNANPQLADCSPSSLILAVARAVAWGGVVGEDVHLVPFGKNVQPIKDYKFKAKLIQQTGAARQVYAVAVYANEPFRLVQGTEQRIEHEIILDHAKRGKMTGAYAVARLAHGHVQIVSKTVAEIDAIRQKHSKSWKAGELPEWYALKTVIHQLAKLLPSNPALAKLLAEDEAIEAGGELLPVGLTVSTPAPREFAERALPRGSAHAYQQSDGAYDLDTPPSDSEAEAPDTDARDADDPTLGLDDARPKKPSTRITD